MIVPPRPVSLSISLQCFFFLPISFLPKACFQCHLLTLSTLSLFHFPLPSSFPVFPSLLSSVTFCMFYSLTSLHPQMFLPHSHMISLPPPPFPFTLCLLTAPWKRMHESTQWLKTSSCSKGASRVYASTLTTVAFAGYDTQLTQLK